MIRSKEDDNDPFSTPYIEHEKISCDMNDHISIEMYENRKSNSSSSSLRDYIIDGDDDDLIYDLYDPLDTVTTDFSSNALAISQRSLPQVPDFMQKDNKIFPHPHIGYMSRQNSETLSKTTIELREDPSKANQPSYSPKILKSVMFQNLRIHTRDKSSSTSTLFMNTTIESPDPQEILKCMSNVLHWNIIKYEQLEIKYLDDMFSEEIHPISDKKDFDSVPDENAIFKFLKSIFNAGQLSAECGIMAMAYIDRYLAFTGISFVSSNWRRIVLGCLILASKVWEELAVWNVDFVNVFSSLTVKDLNQLERHVLKGLQFNVALKSSVYAKYYFEIRALSNNEFPLKPLDKEGVKRLEERSKGIEESVKQKKMMRSQSAEKWTGPTVHVSLS